MPVIDISPKQVIKLPNQAIISPLWNKGARPIKFDCGDMSAVKISDRERLPRTGLKVALNPNEKIHIPYGTIGNEHRARLSFQVNGNLRFIRSRNIVRVTKETGSNPMDVFQAVAQQFYLRRINEAALHQASVRLFESCKEAHDMIETVHAHFDKNDGYNALTVIQRYRESQPKSAL